ncbi:hypothetical protein HNY73_003291 [Argiope bruennichi]|uniref:Uncharacterized protein n=1 Tax=Argiope bruennichi TaxID=94029 RepID=A0A8T0FXL9_ARGBR|nr:hypothetical protein HNY73_003291 [Argiope bruennichi]
MALLLKEMYTSVIVCCIISSTFSRDINQSLEINHRTSRTGYWNNHDHRKAHQMVSKKGPLNVVISSFDSSHRSDSGDSMKYAVLSELDDFIPDRTVDDKYSYSPGGFYIPHEREAKLNYHFEEVTDDNEKSENKAQIPDKVSIKDSNSKILPATGQTKTGNIERPTFLSVLMKAFLNPLVIISAAAIPLAFIIENVFLQGMNIFSGSKLPTTIANGFARSLNEETVLHVEQLLDAINEFGVKLIEDPKCLQSFICQLAESQSQSHPISSWPILLVPVQKIMQKLENSVDYEILNKYGLKEFFYAVKNTNVNHLCVQDHQLTFKMSLYSKRFTCWVAKS